MPYLIRLAVTRSGDRVIGGLAILMLAVMLRLSTGSLSAAEKDRVVLTEGPATVGRLVAVDDKWNFRFVNDGKESVIAGEKMVRWGRLPQSGRGARIILSGGGLIIAQPLAISKEHLQVESELLGTIKIPRTFVRGLIFLPPHDRRQREALTRRITEPTGEDRRGEDRPGDDQKTVDRLILVNGDHLSGRVRSLAEETLALQSGRAQLRIELATVSAIALEIRRDPVPHPKKLHAMIGLSDGSRLSVTSFSTQGKTATLRLLDRVDLQCKLEQVVSVQMFGALATYLSDLTPVSYRHVPYLKLPWSYQTDRSVTGLALRCHGGEYLKGLGMHSTSRITYRLDKPYRRLEAELGIDDDTGGKGSVLFRVFVDDRSGKWKLRYTSPTIRGGEPPTAISVDLTGARQVSLIVDFADRGDEMDHADWLDARLLP